MKTGILTVSLAIGLAMPVVQGAETGPDALIVPSGDLDLSREADNRRLAARIRIAVRRICAQSDGSNLAIHSERACRRSAMVRMGPAYPRM